VNLRMPCQSSVSINLSSMAIRSLSIGSESSVVSDLLFVDRPRSPLAVILVPSALSSYWYDVNRFSSYQQQVSHPIQIIHMFISSILIA